MIDLCSAVVDDARDPVTIEEHVIMPDVAKARLQGKRTIGPENEGGGQVGHSGFEDLPGFLGQRTQVLGARGENIDPGSPVEPFTMGMQSTQNSRARAGGSRQPRPCTVQQRERRAGGLDAWNGGLIVEIGFAW